MKRIGKRTTGLLALLLALIMTLSVPVSAMEEEVVPSDIPVASGEAAEDEVPSEEQGDTEPGDENLGETEAGDAETIIESRDEGTAPGESDTAEEPGSTEERDAAEDANADKTVENYPGETEYDSASVKTGSEENTELAEEDAAEDPEPIPDDPSFQYLDLNASATVNDNFAEVTDAFSAYIVTSYGTVKSYYTGGVYYLFTPNGFPLSSLTIHYNGAVTAVSKGSLDTAVKTVAGAFSHGDAVVFTLSGGSTRTVKLMQSSVPSLSVWLNGYSLSDIHANKDLKAAGTSVTMADPSNAVFDLNVSGAAEFKGRGNSSWNYFSKKGYQIKFDKKTSMFGEGAAKKWVLIANANDGSMMKNKIAYELASSSAMAFVPSAHYADLWINGEYQGLYLVTDKVEIGKTRLNLKDDKGVLVEMDNVFYYDENIYFRSSVTGYFYTMKEAVNEDSREGMVSFKAAIEALETKLHQKASWSEIKKLADVQSFADMYLINDIMNNTEVLLTSFFYYKDGDADVIHMGPVWDFDSCMNYLGQSASSSNLIYNGSTFGNVSDIFKCLSYYQEFVDLVKTLYYGHYQQDLQNMLTKIESWYSQIRISSDMNYTRWPSLGTTSEKGEYIYPTYRGNVDSILNWLRQRVQVYVPIYKTNGSSASIGTAGGGGVTSLEEQLQYYKLVFDPQYYANKYSDLKAAFGNDKARLLSHFLNYGIMENRQAISNFNIVYYKSRNADLRALYGDNNTLYMEHYINTGYKEGRPGSSAPTYIGNSIDNDASGGTGDGAGTGTGTNTGTVSYYYNGREYSPVFDAEYYLAKYADLRAAFGTDKTKAFSHFLNNGMREGRRACENFDVQYYRNRYPDLQRAFGTNYTNYVHHYLDHGIKEGRIGSTETAAGGSSGGGDDSGPGSEDSGNTGESGDPGDMGSTGTDTGESGNSGSSGTGNENQEETLNLGSYALVFDADYYLNKYPDLRAAYGTDKVKAFNHFKKHGMNEARQAIASFNPVKYKARYVDLQRAFGNNWPAYYNHYMNNGYREGRIAY